MYVTPWNLWRKKQQLESYSESHRLNIQAEITESAVFVNLSKTGRRIIDVRGFQAEVKKIRNFACGIKTIESIRKCFPIKTGI